MNECEKLSSDACIRSGIVVLITVAVFISVLNNIETMERFKFYAKYIELRLNLKLGVEEFENQPCWNYLNKNAGADNKPINLKIINLEETCTSVSKELTIGEKVRQ